MAVRGFSCLLLLALSACKPGTSLTGEHTTAEMSHSLGTLHRLPLRGRLVEGRGTPDPASTTPLQDASQDAVQAVRSRLEALGQTQATLDAAGEGMGPVSTPPPQPSTLSP